MAQNRQTAHQDRFRRKAFALARDRYGGDIVPCGICGRDVDLSMTRLVGGDWAPVADHIVPLARGGSWDAEANSQVTHALCNARKGDGSAAPKRARTAYIDPQADLWV